MSGSPFPAPNSSASSAPRLHTQISESLKLALEALVSHKLRSFLTLLGIIISVCTLVAVVSLVQGMNVYVGTKIARLGSNSFSIEQFTLEQDTDYNKRMEAIKRNPALKMATFQFLRENSGLASAVSATAERSASDVKAGDKITHDVQVIGTTSDSIRMATYDVSLGRFISPFDDEHSEPVAFIGPDVAKAVFPGLNPIGGTIEFDHQDYRVVGEASVQGNVFGRSQDDFIIIPLSTYLRNYGSQGSLSIQVQARSADLLPATEDEIRMLLRTYRHLPYSAPDNFGIIGADTVMDLYHKITGSIAAVMVGVSAVFLVVGGIVIMNIMLAAVTERTREVGIRKSLGARRSDVLWQFLIESAVLSTAGGLLGVILAFAFTAVAKAATPIPFSLPWLAVVVALLISTAVGLFFGIYPASKAAKLDPIVALRAEL